MDTIEIIIDQTTYFGILTKEVYQFSNVRYAISQRYQLPQPFHPNERIGTQERNVACPQKLVPFIDEMIEAPQIESFDINESPQLLTIYRPKHISNNTTLPVVVWIHGGSYEIGNHNVPTSTPYTWVEEQNFIFISVGYRLGIFGFLGDDIEYPSNLGMLDVCEALRWIHSNIEYFSGDKNNITMLGQSSGGDMVAHLMTLDWEKPLFHKAIIHSAPLGLRKGRTKMNVEFFNKCLPHRHIQDPMLLVEKIESAKPSVLKYGLKAAMPFGLQYGHFPLAKEKEIVERWKKNATKYQVLIGYNMEETAFYIKSSDAGKKYFRRGVAKKLIDKTVQLTTNAIYANPAHAFARMYGEAGGKGYIFSLQNFWDTRFGGAHCIDLALLFGDQHSWENAKLLEDIGWEKLMAEGKNIRTYWANFAKTGSIDTSKTSSKLLNIRKF